ncbi:hypothetical protein MCETRH20_00715 [Methylophilaceae bacterium]
MAIRKTAEISKNKSSVVNAGFFKKIRQVRLKSHKNEVNLLSILAPQLNSNVCPISIRHYETLHEASLVMKHYKSVILAQAGIHLRA